MRLQTINLSILKLSASRAVLFFLIFIQNASCQNTDKSGTNQDTTKSYILPENKGSIDRILMLYGDVADYFFNHKDRYGPCVIFPQQYFREFYSNESVNATILGRQLSVELKPEWWSKADFDSVKFESIINDHKIDLTELATWLNINMPFSQLYSIALNSDGKTNLTDFDEEERIYFVHALKKIGDLEPVEESAEIKWQSSGVGFESITVRKNIVVSLRESKTLPTVQKIDSLLSISEKKLLLSAQYRFEKSLRRAIDSVYMRVMHEENVSGMTLLFDQRICYCDYRSNPDCEQLCESRTSGSFMNKYLQDILHVRYENDSLNLNTSVPYTDKNPCKIAKYISTFVDDMTCSGAGSVPDRLCGIAGGNMMITDKLAFVGKNELVALQKSQNRRDILRHGLSEKKQDIESCLLNLIYADTSGRKIVWVGTADSVVQYSAQSTGAGVYSYQPVYHIDLFFHPLGDISGNKEFYYFLAEPVDVNPVLCPSTTQNLNDVFKKIGNSVNQEIRKLGYEPRPIRVPLGIKLTSGVTGRDKCYRVSRFYSFTNGLVEVRDGQWRYLHTDYSADNIKLYNSAVGAAKKRIQAEIFNATGKNPTFIPVEIDENSQDSGLRCLVKVIARGQ